MNNHALRVYDSIRGLLSDVDNPTPLVRLSRVVPHTKTEVYAKLEWYNPFGAVKDRVAANMVDDAKNRGVIGVGQKLVEPTSGNTGLGLAMVANAEGYQLTTPVSNQIPLEKRTMLRLFGADVVELEDDLCPAPWAPDGAIARAHQIAEQPDYHMLDQYENEANPDAHYRTTGPEIWRQTEGTVTHLVAGLGTCGTITGTGRFLKEQDSTVQVLGVYPGEGHDIPGVRSLPRLQNTRFFNPDDYDGMVEIGNEEAFELCQRLNREESITAGPSSGMALAGALKLIPDRAGNVAIVIFPDSAFKYASSVVKNLAGLGPVQTDSGGKQVALLGVMVENTRVNPDLTVDVEAAHGLWQQEDKPTVIDVRTYDDFRRGHIPGAINLPLHEMADRVDELPQDLEGAVLSVCQRGNLSLSGVLFLTSLGYRNARSVTGGTNAWTEKGFATESS